MEGLARPRCWRIITVVITWVRKLDQQLRRVWVGTVSEGSNATTSDGRVKRSNSEGWPFGMGICKEAGMEVVGNLFLAHGGRSGEGMDEVGGGNRRGGRRDDWTIGGVRRGVEADAE